MENQVIAMIFQYISFGAMKADIPYRIQEFCLLIGSGSHCFLPHYVALCRV